MADDAVATYHESHTQSLVQAESNDGRRTIAKATRDRMQADRDRMIEAADLIAGELGADDATAGADAGAVHVVFGADGLTGTQDLAVTPADFTLIGPAAGARLGAVAVGRLDEDGQDDLVARTLDTAYVLFGPVAAGTQELATTPADVTVSGLASVFYLQ